MPHRPHIVPDQLAENLRLVLCGTAPSAISAQKLAYYANPGNQFWKTLHRVGLTPGLLSPHEYPQLLKMGIGLTDLCKSVSGNDDELPPEALERDELTKKIKRFQPALVAFTSKNAGQIYFGRKLEYGLQEETLGRTKFYVCCSTSGRARRFWQEQVWLGLAALVNDPAYKTGTRSK